VNGYFSRLAKQSGLRFTGAIGSKPRTVQNPAPRPPAPLEVEETIFTSPTSSDRARNPPREKPGEQPQPVEGSRPKLPLSKSQGPKLPDPAKENLTEPSVASHTRQEFPRQSNSTTPRRETPSQLAPSQNRETAPAGQPAAPLRQSEPNEPKTNPLRLTEVRGQTDTEKTEKPKAKRVEAELPETGEKKQFFAKTAEALERGKVDSAEIQHILLLEVQEWAAASPTAEPDRLAGEKSNAAEKMAQPKAPAGAAVIGKQLIRRESQAQTFDPGQIEEQNFDLSIGTISVVIEDSAKPPQLPEPKGRDQERATARREAPRSFSRLSRNYL